jgi:hypothetical protein
MNILSENEVQNGVAGYYVMASGAVFATAFAVYGWCRLIAFAFA